MVLVVQGGSLCSQELSGSEGNQITFPTLVGTPDLELSLPMHLSISEQVKIGHLSMEVSFPSPQLAFVGVRKASLKTLPPKLGESRPSVTCRASPAGGASGWSGAS